MRASVINDSTVRKIDIDVEGAPDIDVTRYYHRKPRAMRPIRATIRVVDGEVRSINVAGGLVLKSGTMSTDIHEKTSWSSLRGWGTEEIGNAPEWVRSVWAEAPAGVTSWTWPDRGNAEEVQAL